MTARVQPSIAPQLAINVELELTFSQKAEKAWKSFISNCACCFCSRTPQPEAKGTLAVGKAYEIAKSLRGKRPPPPLHELHREQRERRARTLRVEARAIHGKFNKSPEERLKPTELAPPIQALLQPRKLQIF